jgi:periplasmic protein TonB
LSRIDIIAAFSALALHAGIAYGLAKMPIRETPKNTVVEVDVRKKVLPPEPPKLTPPEPPKPPEPEPPKKVVMKQKNIVTPPPSTPPPNATPPKEPPAEPPKPVFGVTMSSTTEGDSSFSVPVGNTTMIDPSKSAKTTGPVAPLPAAPAGPAKAEYKPVSELYIKTMPDIDSDACGKTIQYPAEAEQLGIEGDVKLRVSLDEKGHVHDVKVLSGLGHGLDQAAMHALKHKCRFSPAIATDGKAVPYVIPAYVFHFEIPR